MATPHALYILQSETADRFYVGRSSNPERRLQHHNATSTGFTARYRPWRLVFAEWFPSKQQAVAAERLVKSWKSKKMTRYVIDGRISLKERLEAA